MLCKVTARSELRRRGTPTAFSRRARWAGGACTTSPSRYGTGSPTDARSASPPWWPRAGSAPATPGAAVAWSRPGAGRAAGRRCRRRRDADGSGLVEVTIGDDDAAGGRAGLRRDGHGARAAGVGLPARAVGAAGRPRAGLPRDAGRRASRPVGDTLFTPATIREATRFGDTGAAAVRPRGDRDGRRRRRPGRRRRAVAGADARGRGRRADRRRAVRDGRTLLGWSVRVEARLRRAVAAARACCACDAVVVLSHDRDVDGPALRAALAGGAGYVGALGSRRTQAARGRMADRARRAATPTGRASTGRPGWTSTPTRRPRSRSRSSPRSWPGGPARAAARCASGPGRCTQPASRRHRRVTEPAAKSAGRRLTSSCRNAASRVGVECPSATHVVQVAARVGRQVLAAGRALHRAVLEVGERPQQVVGADVRQAERAHARACRSPSRRRRAGAARPPTTTCAGPCRSR